jgi:RimJ/RimL family protein N-acetyltransferase
MTHKGTVTLETERLILRRLELNDASAMFHNWANNPEVARFLMWTTHSDVVETDRILNEWIPLCAKRQQGRNRQRMHTRFVVDSERFMKKAEGRI